MKSVRGAAVIFTALCTFSACGAAEAEMNFSLSATTGDKEFDVTLRSVNLEAKQNLPSFYSAMSLNFGAREQDLHTLLGVHLLSPADAYMVIRISVVIGQPIDYVLARYHKHKKKGWGYIAKKLGIKPGSPEFHRLKTGCTVVLERSRMERQKDEELKMKAVRPDNGPDGNGPEKRGGHGGEGKGKGRQKK